MAAAAEATPRYRPEHIKGRGGFTRFRLDAPPMGETYGRLTVIGSSTKRDKGGKRYWLFRCSCGTVKEHIASKVIGGEISSCGCLKRERSRASVTKYADPLTKYRNRLLGHYKRHAEARNFSFEIPPEEFHRLTQQPCEYCGRSMVNRHSHNSVHSKRTGEHLSFNGIDRINSAHGYVPGNVVPCCKVCNFMKQSLTQSEFIDNIRLILKHYCQGAV